MKALKNIIYVAFAGVAVASAVQAVNPPPDGGYPGGNTAAGQNALFGLTSGGYNTAVGFLSLSSNTEGNFNTALGAGALLANIGDPTAQNGEQNTATGAGALLSNTTGYFNTANGAFALLNNTTGFYNTAIGQNALLSNTTGDHNGANDDNALASNTTGSFNTGTGHQAAANNTTGKNNTATGTYSLFNNVTGNANTADGVFALGNSTGTFNVGIGTDAGCILTSGDNNIYIGSFGVDTESDTIRIGREVQQTNCGGFSIPAHTTAYIAGISGTAVVGETVVVDANGQLGTATSSARFKREIQPMNKTTEAILALKPVRFQYKSDSKGTPQFGLIAEEVAKVNPDLVIRDRNGEIYSVRYEAVNAMLLNEFLKEHQAFVEEQRKVQEQGATIARLEKQVAALTAGLQKVSAQLEVNKPAQQTAANSH